MEKIKLEHFLQKHTQQEAAEIIGCTQGAIHQMILNKRDVFFQKDGKGNLKAYEIKSIAKSNKKSPPNGVICNK